MAPWRSQALKLRPGRCIVKYVNHQDGGDWINPVNQPFYLRLLLFEAIFSEYSLINND
jgi:hypothetical protein